MLKIKENVDLKELEKFGFVKHEFVGDIDVKDWHKLPWYDENDKKIKAPELKKEDIEWAMYYKDCMGVVIFDTPSENNELMTARQILNEDIDGDTLYDLIKADLVEKVGE
jgi:hypothetical protein